MGIRTVLFAIAIAPTALTAQAPSDSALKACASIRIGTSRLACYDRLIPPGAAAPASLTTGSIVRVTQNGSWVVSENGNPIDDSKTVALILEAADGRTRLGRAPTLVLRCQSGKLEAYVNWNDFMGSDESDVTSRIGNNRAEKNTWRHSSDNEATFFPGNSAWWIDTLARSEQFVTQATPYDESPITAVFRLVGLKEASAKLFAACPTKH